MRWLEFLRYCLLEPHRNVSIVVETRFALLQETAPLQMCIHNGVSAASIKTESMGLDFLDLLQSPFEFLPWYFQKDPLNFHF